MASKNRREDGSVLIFRRTITRNGKVLDARHYGKKAWPIWIKPNEKR